MDRLKIALVMGMPFSKALIEAFRGLANLHEITLFRFCNQGVDSDSNVFMKSKIFDEVVDMSGYMKGLEGSLHSFDVIFAFEIYQLSTLQAYRASLDYQKPLFVFITQDNPIPLPGRDNLNAIASKVLSGSVNFVVVSDNISDTLVKVGVCQDKIHHISIPVQPKYQFLSDARTKFRSLIQCGSVDKIILFEQSLIKQRQPEIILKALKVLRKIDSTFRVIFAGDGDYAKQLQYLAYNIGLGGQSYFLSQDTEDFKVDLLSACDYYVCPKDHSTQYFNIFPNRLLEAMACGLIPVVASDSPQADLLQKNLFSQHIMQKDSYLTLAAHLRLLSRVNDAQKLHSKSRDYTKAAFSLAGATNSLTQLLDKCLSVGQGCKSSLASTVFELEQAAKNGECSVLESIQNILTQPLPWGEKSKLLCIEGELYTNLGSYDAAINSFEHSLYYVEGNARSYRGLGYVSWYSYAHEEAMIFFKRALSYEPNDSQSLLGVGLTYKRIGMIEEAIFWIEKSLVADANASKKQKSALIQACTECRDIEYALHAVKRAVDLLGEDPSLMRAMGQLNLKLGKNEVAYKILQDYVS